MGVDGRERLRAEAGKVGTISDFDRDTSIMPTKTVAARWRRDGIWTGEASLS